MKQIVAYSALLGALMLAVPAGAKDQSMTGWISDSKCGAKGANAGHATCAQKCVQAGEKPVFVSDKDQKVIPIDNPDAVSKQIGQHVQVSGSMSSSGALHVDKVQTKSD